jgi:hypothetical protein
MNDRACFICSKEVEAEGEDHCDQCIEKMLGGKPKARTPALDQMAGL